MSDWKNVQYKNGKMRTSEGGGGGGSSTFAGLDDVNFSDLQDGQVPKYNATTEKWENANESGGGGTVTDVQVDGVSVVNPQGVAEIEMPTPPTIPVEDVLVNGTSVVDANNEAQIKSYKEVTQAEYQALPSSKLTDNILYCIKDSAGADGFPPLIYSDEEREVGVWKDGKPLYTITLVKTGTFATGSYVSHDISDLSIDTMVELYGWAERFVEGSNITIWHPLNYYEGANYSVASRYNATSKTIDIRCAYSSGNLCRTQIFNIYYTKTTDTAGSGTWTGNGALAHHYSTDEHVIGTWIDGKPLYEKTIPLTLSYGDGVYKGNSEITSDTLDYANIVEGVALRNDGANVPVGYEQNVSAYIHRQTQRMYFTCRSECYSAIVVVRYTKTTD